MSLRTTFVHRARQYPCQPSFSQLFTLQNTPPGRSEPPERSRRRHLLPVHPHPRPRRTGGSVRLRCPAAGLHLHSCGPPRVSATLGAMQKLRGRSFGRHPLGWQSPPRCALALLPAHRELRLALLLAAQLSRRHGGALQEHAARLESTFHPTGWSCRWLFGTIRWATCWRHPVASRALLPWAAEHSPWGPGIDAQYPELSSSADSSDDEDSSGTGGDEHSHASSGSSASAGSPASLLGLSHRGGSSSGAASWAMSAKTLRFSDLRMERRFQHWRNARLARVGGGLASRKLSRAPALKSLPARWRALQPAVNRSCVLGGCLQVDMTALLSLLVYHGACCLLPPFTDCHPGWLASSLLPALAVLAPLLLLLLNPSKHWYSRHRWAVTCGAKYLRQARCFVRSMLGADAAAVLKAVVACLHTCRDQLLICTYLLLACHHALDLAAQLDQAPEGMWRVVVLRVEALWCLVLGIVLQVGWGWQGAWTVAALRPLQGGRRPMSKLAPPPPPPPAPPPPHAVLPFLQVQFVGQCLMLVGSLLLKALVQPGCVQLLGAAAQTCSLVGPGAAAAASGCFLGDSGRWGRFDAVPMSQTPAEEIDISHPTLPVCLFLQVVAAQGSHPLWAGIPH